VTKKLSFMLYGFGGNAFTQYASSSCPLAVYIVTNIVVPHAISFLNIFNCGEPLPLSNRCYNLHALGVFLDVFSLTPLLTSFLLLLLLLFSVVLNDGYIFVHMYSPYHHGDSTSNRSLVNKPKFDSRLIVV
jgi:hypothetical protein